MPVSLLTPIAHDLGTEGMAGQSISISGLFAVGASLLIATVGGRFDRRYVLMGLTVLMLASLVVIAEAPNLGILMVARAILGMVIGGFWSLATATVMRLVPEDSVPKALGVVYTGNAVATAFAAPIGSISGADRLERRLLGACPNCRAESALAMDKPACDASTSGEPCRQARRAAKAAQCRLCNVRSYVHLRRGVCDVHLSTAVPETYARVSVLQLFLLLLGLGVAGFVGTYGAGALLRRHLYSLLVGLPLALAAVTLVLLAVRHQIWAVAGAMIAWGALNSAIPVTWSTWLTKGISDEPESGSGLIVGAIQLSIMLGAAFGGLLLDHISVGAPLVGGAAILLLASLTVGDGNRLIIRPQTAGGPSTREALPLKARLTAQ